MKNHFVVCVGNKGYEASLEIRKIYQTIHDLEASKHDQVRVIDESGEDYLYPNKCFSRIILPCATKEKIEELAIA